MTGVSVEITGDTEATLHLEDVAARTLDLTPALGEIYKSFLDIEAKRFANEGPGWAALAPTTLAEKEKRGYPSTILEATGALKKSLTISGSPGAVLEVDPQGVTMGSDLLTADGGYVLGSLHQTGTSRMPKRPVIDTTQAHVLEWAAIIQEWVLEGAAGTATTMSLDLGPTGL